MGAKPEDVRDCKEGAQYILKRTNFTVDNDITPGAEVNMKTDFLANGDGKISKFLFKVLVMGKNIYTEKYDADVEFKNG